MVWEEASRAPGVKEVAAAAKKLKLSSPGCPGISTVAVKAMLLDDGEAGMLVGLVVGFWEGGGSSEELGWRSFEDPT